VNWNDYPAFFKRGVYLRRVTREAPMSFEEWGRVPEGHRPPPATPIKRTRVMDIQLPPIRTITNREAVLFEGATPEMKEGS
jgi:hypothetical protein